MISRKLLEAEKFLNFHTVFPNNLLTSSQFLKKSKGLGAGATAADFSISPLLRLASFSSLFIRNFLPKFVKRISCPIEPVRSDALGLKIKE